MTKPEAIQAMLQGKRVTHEYFTPDEWMKSDSTGEMYTFEDGVRIPEKLFWDDRQHHQWHDNWRLFDETELPDTCLYHWSEAQFCSQVKKCKLCNHKQQP